MKKACILAACFSTAGGIKIVNDGLSWCMDLKLECADGKSERVGCERVEVTGLKKLDLQMYPCHGKHNQEFEFHDDGRIRNPKTGLCVDIEAPCKDGSSHSHCSRSSVQEIKEKANIQLWTCHEDSGSRSASYGNQKWTWKVDGSLRNTGSGLCIEAKAPADGRAAVHASVCSGKGNQIFEFETRDVANSQHRKVDVNEEKFSVLVDGGFLPSSVSSGIKIPLTTSVGLLFLSGVACLFVRNRGRQEFAPAE